MTTVNDFPFLTAAILLPLLGAAVLMGLPRRSGRDLPQVVALGVSLVTLALTAVMAVRFDPGGGFQFNEQHTWIAAFGAHYAVGVDGIGLTLVMLTTILTPAVIGASWRDGDPGRWSTNSFFAWVLVLEALAIGVFAATDVFLFYVLFEATLLPIYFLIGGFGGARRSYAAIKFLLYSLLGGLVMLASVIGLYVESSRAGAPTYLLSELSEIMADVDTATGRWLFVGFFIAFAIKAPMVPVHTWLPDVADEATPGTSVLLVSILDKIGTFGMIRFCLGLFPEASTWATPVVLVLAVVSVLYGGLVAIAQDSIPRLIAYTSVSHFGFIVLGIFVLNSQGQTGSTLYMFNHGLSTGLLFLVSGFLIARRGSRYISDFGGVQKVAPVLAGILLVAGLSSLSLPGLSPFVSEFLVMLGAFLHHYLYAVFAVFGIVLSALYILLMYQRTMTGPVRPEVEGMRDLGFREVASLAPLLALVVALGFFPGPLLDVIEPAVASTLEHVGAEDPGPTIEDAAADAEPTEGGDE
ncbi:MAG: NADH-ubiquinone oxidoreductase chain M [uncultured Nocardioidaceae bacterium]|uniref:NADH-ubiquinone oxidoreductase chain M n=1 Tax=uncultured Nocardioidaceae bacterium TaxID=253824 RepID=A0A6J4MEC4_9ACTN|nr:MAG: NADH-ubiquinone oxidoreductase chain M [uncultured Nocardioidaceae bacterium]